MATETTTKLELQFEDGQGKKKTVAIKSPREGIDRQAAESVVNTISTTEIFENQDGDVYVKGIGARYVRRTIEDIYQVDTQAS